MNCIFCRIGMKQERHWMVWESLTHMAFLTPSPNAEGFTVVAPKEHLTSHVFALSDESYIQLLMATRIVSRILESAFDVARCGMFIEGMGVDHAHTKLSPLHGVSARSSWVPVRSELRTTYPSYRGYIASHDGPPAEPSSLDATLARIRPFVP
jgi:histidine triad (HIT) family protein